MEWGFILEHLPAGPGRCLDFGPGGSTLATRALERGFVVTALDLDDTDWQHQPGVEFIHADIFETNLPPASFDLVINCSTIEHIGLPGRYGVIEMRLDGDLEAMTILRDLMKPDGIMLLTVPVGQDTVFIPMARVYGAKRLPHLLEGFTVEVERYYIKDDNNDWAACPRVMALAETPSVEDRVSPAGNLYALGLFVLRKDPLKG